MWLIYENFRSNWCWVLDVINNIVKYRCFFCSFIWTEQLFFFFFLKKRGVQVFPLLILGNFSPGAVFVFVCYPKAKTIGCLKWKYAVKVDKVHVNWFYCVCWDTQWLPTLFLRPLLTSQWSVRFRFLFWFCLLIDNWFKLVYRRCPLLYRFKKKKKKKRKR